MTAAEEELAAIIAQALREAVVPLKKRLDAIEARAAALEQRGVSVHYAGIFEEGRAYPRGALVTRGGSLWLALVDASTPPGSGPSWKLIVKSGDRK